MSDRVQFRRDTRARWSEVNPILMEGEIGLEIDTNNIKMGDGVHAWNELEYGVGIENITSELGNSENLSTSQKLVTDKLSDLSISTNNISIIDDSYFDLSNFTEAENVETNKGLYGFGQGLNDTPLHPTASFTKKFSKSIEGAGSAGVYLYLKDCHAANKDYRTYAIYDKNGKLIREGVSTTNVVLYIERSFTVLAFCEGIYYVNVYTAKAKSVNEKLLEIDGMNPNQLSGINIDPQSTTLFDTSKMTKVTADAEVLTGLYGFGQVLNDTPLHPTAGNTLKYVTKDFTTASRGFFIYLQGCSVANKDYRTYAIYDKNGKLIREGVSTTNVVLYIKEKSTILACCSNIYIAYTDVKFDSVNEKILDLFNKDACVNVIDNCQGIDTSKLTDASSFITKCEINGIYYFGQGINEVPHFKNDGHKTYKFEITNLKNSSTGRILFYVKNLSVANNDYRSWAVYAGDNNELIKEGTATFSNSDTAFFITGLENWYDKITILISCAGDGEFYYCNPSYINLKYDIQKRIKNLETQSLIPSLLTGKTIWTLWDSLGQNTWQNHFTEISGTIFHEDLNLKADKPLSWGGSDSTPSSDDATQQRALNLISYKNSYPIDYVFIENINDRGNRNFGTIEDKPFMRSQRIIYSSGKIFTDYNSANTYLENNKSEIINTIQNRKVGTIISIPYQGGSAIRGSKVKFLTRPALEGDISINVNGHNYSVHVNTAMTIQDVVDEFIKYSYGPGWTDVDNGDGSISIFFYTETSFNITFDGGDTGVTANVEDTSGGGYVHTYYLGENIDDTNWNDVNNWGNGVTLFSIYKGLIEYLQKEIPQTKLYWVAPFSIGVDFSANTYKKSDGSWSQDKYRQSELYKSNRRLYEVQKAVCEYYNILFLDLDSKSGMSIINIENYFNTNNVHPKKLGYDRYAEAILNLM